MRFELRATLCLLLALAFFMRSSSAFAEHLFAADDKASPSATAESGAEKEKTNKTAEARPAPLKVEERLNAMEQTIERQQREIQALREMLEKQMIEKQAAGNATARLPEAISEASQPEVAALDKEISPASAAATQSSSTRSSSTRSSSTQSSSTQSSSTQSPSAQQKIDELYSKFGSLRVSGDIRFREETFYNQGFDSLTEAPSRSRLRVRARLAIDGTLNKHFDWGLRFATGIFTDPITTNQTLTEFFERKPFSLDRAFVRYDSKSEVAGVQLVAGRFEPTFRRTQMVWDDDVNVEGASEALYFKTKSSLKQIKLVAFQLPFDESSGGKDGVLYGGQLQTDWRASSELSANFNVAYYNWVRADHVVQALGASITQVNGGITNGAGVTGGQNGSLGTTNRIIRDERGNPIGLLANFHLFDVLGQLTWRDKSRFPVILTFDFVRNLSNRIDDEKNGYWAGVQVGQTREKNDWSFGYAFTRIEQDAVLVPFNFSDILASNSRAHMPTIAYQLNRGVTLQWGGLFSQRANKIVPLSPVNRWVNRMQFDVIYKF